MTVSIDTEALAESITALSGLAGRIDSQRKSASAGTPVGLDSLTDASSLAQKAQWLRDQQPELQKLADLATLLDTDGDGFVDYEGDGSLDEAERLLIDELTDGLESIDDMDSPQDREQLEQYAEVFARYSRVPEVAGPVIEELGAEGTIDALYALQSRLTEQGLPNYRGGEYIDNITESDAIRELQDELAGSISIMVGTASINGYLPDDFGKELVNNDARGWGVATLFNYGGYRHVDFGQTLLVSAGEALLEREQEQGSRYWTQNGNITTGLSFGVDQDNDDNMNDPTLQWLRALDENVDASQEILLDTDRAEYLLGDRESRYEDPKGDAAGDVLRVATVDQALGYNPDYDTPGGPEDVRARNAAQISSNTLDYFGEGKEPPPGLDEEIGGIISTYIADVDRTSSRSDDGGPGIYEGDHPDRPAFLDGSDLPYYGINIDKGDLTDILEDVGDNDSAVTTIGGAASRYNQVRLNEGADLSLNGPEDGQPSWGVGTDGDPMVKSINESSELQGYLQDGLINGAIDNAESDAEARKKVAGLFMLPTEFIPIPGGPAGDFIVGEIKSAVTDAYVGDGVNEAISEGNDQYETGRRSTQLQAYYSLLGAQSDEPWSELNAGDQNRVDDNGNYAVGDLRDNDVWPGSEEGHPVPPSELTETQIRSILDRGDQVPGYGGTVGSTVSGAWDNESKKYGDN